VISAGGGRRRPDQGEPGTAGAPDAAPAAAGEAAAADPAAPLVPEVDPDLERLLAEEEEIERKTREAHHEAPHMRREVD
jgi:small subunit ribosomal protein S3